MAGFRLAGDLRWFTGTGTGTGEVVCHGDFGPWNVVWRGDQPVGILDWDYARPAPRLHDVAYALEYVARSATTPTECGTSAIRPPDGGARRGGRPVPNRGGAARPSLGESSLVQSIGEARQTRPISGLPPHLSTAAADCGQTRAEAGTRARVKPVPARPMAGAGPPNGRGRPAQWPVPARPMAEAGPPNGRGRPAQGRKPAGTKVLICCDRGPVKRPRRSHQDLTAYPQRGELRDRAGDLRAAAARRGCRAAGRGHLVRLPVRRAARAGVPRLPRRSRRGRCSRRQGR
ncbi:MULTISPECIES: phosphotransferase [unclassified Amycolatopsis]|uniref:phosphotransferase n=1 Tax=unclassified Amycolatopsis TaxID=2618356 RepID=UPI0037C13416